MIFLFHYIYTDVAIGITNVKKEASSPCDEVEIKSRGKQRLKQKTGDIGKEYWDVIYITCLYIWKSFHCYLCRWSSN